MYIFSLEPCSEGHTIVFSNCSAKHNPVDSISYSFSERITLIQFRKQEHQGMISIIPDMRDRHLYSRYKANVSCLPLSP